MTWQVVGGVLKFVLPVILFFGGYFWGVQDARTETALTSTKQANTAWVERFTLESQLATRDVQLAELQQAVSAVRTETITKREVVYRDRIKVRTVRDCIADSGLFELYNSTLGVTGGQ